MYELLAVPQQNANSLNFNHNTMAFDPAPFQAAAREIGKGLKPVIETREDGDLLQVGTAFALANGNRRLVVTANHVVDSPLAKGIAFSELGAARWPQHYARLEAAPGHAFDPDVAFSAAEVDPQFDAALTQAIPHTQVVTGVEVGVHAHFVAIGYPGSKARFRDAQSRLSNKLMYVAVQGEPLEVYEELELDPRVYLAVKYDRHARVDLALAATVGANPPGMSGGVLALATERVLPSGAHQVELYVAGVLIRYYPAPQNTLVATRMDCLLDAVSPFRSEPDRLCVGVDV